MSKQTYSPNFDMAIFSNLREQIETDDTLRRTRKYGRLAANSFPSAARKYFVAKIPVVSWLPKYELRWIINDVIAGVTLGILLIPQALAYAKIATIPPQFGLITSFSPSLVYFFMGTAKDVSVGPTSITALLTSQIIRDFKSEGFRPEVIAAAVAFLVGIYSWTLGLLQLGWLLNFVSVPVLTAFFCAAGSTIVAGQVPSLFGLTASTGEAKYLHDFFADLPKTQGLTLAVGISGIVLLIILQQVGKAWGKQYKFFWLISILRNAIVLVLFTTISYFINKDRQNPVFPLSSTVNAGLIAPKFPNLTLLSKLPARSLAVFIAASLEHLAIGKAIGRRNGYAIDPAQELTALGTANFIGSLFGGMAVSGAISRTSINSESGVKSPLSGLVTTIMVLLSIYTLTGVLFWIPKATLSAIIITAVWQIIVPYSVYYKYWRTSLVDFVSSQLAFWLTLFISAEAGIALAVILGLLYTLVRIAFARTTLITDGNRSIHYPSDSDESCLVVLPDDTKVFKFHQSILFPNAERLKDSIMASIQTYSIGETVKYSQTERIWSDARDRQIAEMRAKAGVNELDLPQTHVVILDLTNVTYIDTTGLQALQDLKAELIQYLGSSMQLRFVGMHRALRKKFGQFGWDLIDADGGGKGIETEGDMVYDGIGPAVRGMRIL